MSKATSIPQSGLWRLPTSRHLQGLFITSCILVCTAFVTLVFKAVSTVAWHHPVFDDFQYVSVDGQIKGWFAFHQADFYGVSRGRSWYDHKNWNYADLWMWSVVVVVFVHGLGTIYSVGRATAKGPYQSIKIWRAVYYLEYHIVYLYALGIFIYLTVNHFRSARLDLVNHSALPYDGLRYADHCAQTGSCQERYGQGLFDIETWACDLRRMPGLQDPAREMDRVCIGESGTRWLLLILGIISIVMAVFVELERRGPRALLRSWKISARREWESDYI